MDKLELYKDKRGKWRGRVVASNGRIMVATTQGYVNKGDCKDAMIQSAHVIIATFL